jgi:hypothetical protein
MIHAIFEVVGIATTVTIFAIIFRMIIKKIPEMHNHSYQVNLLLRAADKERKCEKWDIDLKCEECGKHKCFKFWNDGIRLSVLGEANGTETCVCCGAEIPEGRQVCPACENGEDK